MKAKNPELAIGDVAKELGKRWEACSNRTKYEAQAAKEKERYARVRHCQTFDHIGFSL